MNLVVGVHRQIENACPRRKRAAAIVEMAVVAPLVLTLLFGIIEFGWIFMVTQTLTSAAREGCRTAVLEGSTDTDIYNRVDQVMQNAGITGYSIDVTHAQQGDPTEVVIVRVPYAQVSLLGGYFGGMDKMLQGYAAMRKEGAD